MAKSYKGASELHLEPEDFAEVNIFNMSRDWLDGIKAEYNFENMPDLDLRLFILIDQMEKMATSDGIWFVNLEEPYQDTTPDEVKDDDMVGC